MWTPLILVAILVYAGLVIYRKIKRMKAGNFCCGSCEGCNACGSLGRDSKKKAPPVELEKK